MFGSLSRACLTAIGVLYSSAALANNLFYDNFQTGEAAGWAIGGEGGSALHNYQGNFSLRLNRQAYATQRIPAAGASNVRVGAALSGGSLEDTDLCLAEVSLDDGKSWQTITRVDSITADSLSMHSGALNLAVPDSTKEILLRARVAGNADDDTCWLDNVYVALIEPQHTSPAEPKRNLTVDVLLAAEPLKAPLAMDEFRPGAGSVFPFTGKLRVEGDQTPGFNVVRDGAHRADNESVRSLPGFSVEVVTLDNILLPVNRSMQKLDHPYWEIALQPGRLWHETADGDWRRAALPFALSERAANCTHNGVMTWLYNAEGDTSQVAYQVTAETCSYFQFDMWGSSRAAFEPGLPAAASQAIQRYEMELSSRLPVQPLTRLDHLYPGADPLGLGLDDGIHPADTTALGILVNGVHYRRNCPTRYGDYPFCSEMALPSYSLAKSILAGVGLMRLERRYPGLANRTIAELVKACELEQWRDVTLEQVLDMTSGNYGSASPDADERSAPHVRFLFEESHDARLRFACSHYKRKAEPGSRFVYRTSDTYLLGTAMNAKLAAMQAGELYEFVHKPLWQALHLSPLLDDSKRTYDAAAQVFTGYGMTLTADDTLRIADWLYNGRGRIFDEPMLASDMLASAMQRNAEDRGVETWYPRTRYRLGFWAYDVGPALQCPTPVWVPHMSGVSGITVAMFPNGIIYYYFSDGRRFVWQEAASVAHRIAPMCKGDS
ncbi:MAG: hypothetical protein ACFHX7_13955 [Pseudomonadota bacterium]